MYEKEQKEPRSILEQQFIIWGKGFLAGLGIEEKAVFVIQDTEKGVEYSITAMEVIEGLASSDITRTQAIMEQFHIAALQGKSNVLTLLNLYGLTIVEKDDRY